MNQIHQETVLKATKCITQKIPPNQDLDLCHGNLQGDAGHIMAHAYKDGAMPYTEPFTD